MEGDFDKYSVSEIIEYLDNFINETQPNSEDEYKIALQFPDHLIDDSIEVIDQLQTHFEESKTQIVFFLLGDTSYGEGGVDEVNAQHYCDSTDLILHFGRTGLNLSKMTKTVYVLEKYNHQFNSNLSDKNNETLFFPDGGYQYLFNDDSDVNFGAMPYNLDVIPKMKINSSDGSKEVKILGRHIYSKSQQFELSSYKNIVFTSMGDIESNITYKCLLVNYAHSHKIYTLDLSSPESELGETDYRHNKFLMQRYSLIERIKEASIIGVIMQTANQSIESNDSSKVKSVHNSNSVCNIVKETIHKAGKKCYELLIGKLNEPKLQNFISIDIYVLIAGRENSFYFDDEFSGKLSQSSKPVVTPYELLVALHPNFEWESKATTDYHTYVDKAEETSKVSEQEFADALEIDPIEREENMQLMKLEYGELANVFEQATIERFKQMTFTGLEIVDDEQPAQLENGKVGIATSYEQIQ